ncbi:Troponin T [Armadillidium nasatum]|uniref:Troponin T n=1 Tax=Armadillidium nasatum TaxID=96803 RepID=A0A5N5TC00_9CRUS|nr:Troponin T [Armadillidium nasatum]
MSDDESAFSREEYEEEDVHEVRDEGRSDREDDEGDDGANFLKSRQQMKMSELDEQLAEYIAEWRKQRAKEEDELKKLKDKQAKRKVLRAEEEKKLEQQKKSEEERKLREEAERKQKEQEEKRRRLEEAEKKRQTMMKGSSEGGVRKFGMKGSGDKFSNIQAAKGELGKTKEQLAEEKKIALSIRVKPLAIDGLGQSALKSKADEMWQLIIKLETEKYDMEQRMERQDYDLKELKERQKQQLRQKALKRGLDPEALTGKHPPKIQTASKFERRTDRRTYDDKKKLFEGGWEVVHTEELERVWKEKYEEFVNRTKTRLPKWFGERPGKKGDTDSPEVEEVEEIISGYDFSFTSMYYKNIDKVDSIDIDIQIIDIISIDLYLYFN